MLKALLKFFIGEGDTGEAKGCSCGCASRQSAPVRPVEGGASGGVGELEKFVRFVVDSLVDSPADVKLETVETANGFTIRVSCKKRGHRQDRRQTRQDDYGDSFAGERRGRPVAEARLGRSAGLN